MNRMSQLQCSVCFLLSFIMADFLYFICRHYYTTSLALHLL
jgi:hypothetical protein